MIQSATTTPAKPTTSTSRNRRIRRFASTPAPSSVRSSGMGRPTPPPTRMRKRPRSRAGIRTPLIAARRRPGKAATPCQRGAAKRTLPRMPADETYSEIVLDVSDGVATVTLNRPERLNAYTPTMARELHEAFAVCDADDAVRAIVVTGAGRGFCAGADLARGGAAFDRTAEAEYERGGGPADQPWRKPPRAVAAWDVRKPIIAAINGAAVGVGATLPMQWDIRIAAESARIGFVFVRRGVVPEALSTWTLPRLVGMARAAELLLTGRILSAREALEWGLVSRVVPDAELVPTARSPRRSRGRPRPSRWRSPSGCSGTCRRSSTSGRPTTSTRGPSGGRVRNPTPARACAPSSSVGSRAGRCGRAPRCRTSCRLQGGGAERERPRRPSGPRASRSPAAARPRAPRDGDRGRSRSR